MLLARSAQRPFSRAAPSPPSPRRSCRDAHHRPGPPARPNSRWCVRLLSAHRHRAMAWCALSAAVPMRAGRARARREARRRRGAAGAWAASAGADGQGRRGANADADQERERAARIASCEGCGRASGENSGWSGAASSRQTRKRDDAAPSRLAVVRDTHGGFVTLACRQAVISACRHLGLPLACRQAWMTAGKPSSRLASRVPASLDDCRQAVISACRGRPFPAAPSSSPLTLSVPPAAPSPSSSPLISERAALSCDGAAETVVSQRRRCAGRGTAGGPVVDEGALDAVLLLLEHRLQLPQLSCTSRHSPVTVVTAQPRDCGHGTAP